MMLFRTLLIATTIALSGCAAKVVRTPGPDATQVQVPPESRRNVVLHIAGSPAAMQSKNWPGFRAEWREAMMNEAWAASLPMTMQEGSLEPTGQAGTLISIHVNSFRYVDAGARIGLGVITGNAYIKANIRFLDLKTGRSFGEQLLNTSSTAWEGIFSAMTSQQLEAVAKDLIGDVKPH